MPDGGRPAGRWAVLASVAACMLAAPAQPDYAPPGDLRDLMLIYAGDAQWSVDDFRPYVAYSPRPGGEGPAARQRRPRDWFYDSFLFMQYGGSPSKELYIDGKTDNADWKHFQRLLFDPRSHLHALDQAIAEAAGVLGPPPRPMPIVVMIPYPHPGQANFGDVDGDGVSEDLAQAADRERVLGWYLDAVAKAFAEARFRHLNLYGFYWMIEWIPGKGREEMVRKAAQAVHERDLEFVWIPAYGASDAERSVELGFDLSYLQPNYAFMYQQGREFDPQRLCCAAARAAGSGLGIEIELDPSILRDPRSRQNLLDYLAHGADDRDGYMRGACHAYYQSSLLIKELRDSPLAANRRLYDALYEFARGRYRGSTDRSLAAGRPVKGAAPSSALTDGRFRELLSGEVDAARWRDRALVELDLGGLRPVSGVWVHYQLSEPTDRPISWLSVSASTSAEGDDWVPIPALAPLQVEPPSPLPACRTGAAALRLVQREARRVRVEVSTEPGTTLTLDEIEVLPALPLAPSAQCTVQASGSRRAGEAAAEKLIDGLFADPLHANRAVTWPRGPVELTLDLGLQGYVAGLSLHLPQEGAPMPRSVEVRTAPDEAGTWGEPVVWQAGDAAVGEWLSVSFSPRDARKMLARLQPGAQPLRLDEIRLLAPPNLALHCSYRVQPAWTSKYPDDGKKLTDGVRTTTDFSEGRAVGWFEADPLITVDLGAEEPVETLQIGLEGGGYAAVYLPSQITVLASTDGAAWRLAGEVKPQTLESGDETLLETVSVPLDGRPARYVRVSFRRHWWAMVDEVEVLSGGRNIAAGRPYFLAPPPDPEEKYADTTGAVLTDGELGGTAWGGGKTVGFNASQPVVELDLGRAAPVGKLRAYVLGGGPGAVWFPSRLTVSTSLAPERDGWTEGGTTDEHPSESGAALTGAFMSVDLPGTSAQFVRFAIEPHGWVMMGEIEVYGE